MQKVHTEQLRDYLGPVTNTDIWHGFEMRADDIIVTTPPKCGTTWTLNILMMLIHGRALPGAGKRLEAPWLDCGFRDRQEIAAILEALERRRVIKSHTPMDGIAYGAEPTYFVVYRNPIDAHFSFRTHAENSKDDVLDYMFPADEREGFERFLEAPLTDGGTDDLTVESIVHHYKQAKERQSSGNVHFFHYADMTRDLRGQIARFADLCKIDVSGALLEDLAEANTFANMRKAVEESATRFDETSPFKDNALFFASGTSNKWEGRLTEGDLEAYDARVRALLEDEDAAWLNWGDKGIP